MVFLGIYTALYDYEPQGDNELSIQEGEILYVIEKSDADDWWKAKKRATAEDEEEPVGLIPNNYVEEARPTHQAKALYDYTRQTDEELSFTEDAPLLVYDTSDPDWTLVGLNGEYGFAPANYIEITGEGPQASPGPVQSPQNDAAPEHTPASSSGHSPADTTAEGPAAALAGIMQVQQPTSSPSATRSVAAPPPNIALPPRRPQYTPEASDEEVPSAQVPNLPQRPPSQQISPPPTQFASPRSPASPGVIASPPYNRAAQRGNDDDTAFPSPGGFRLYNINEMASAMGKKKKLPTTLGINVATGTIMIAPEQSRDGVQQEWTAEKLTHYSIEGKHVFMELVRPSKSIDFHAGTKDTAHEIVSMLGDMAGAVRAEGLREVIAAGSGSRGGQKKGQVLYDFMAQGDDEVTVAIGDEVIVLDDTKSEEWWMVRRLKNGNEGVVPSSYVEITGTIPTATSSTSGINAGRSTVEQNRLEEERLAKEATKASRKRSGGDTRGSEVGPGLKLPKRGSSLVGVDDGNTRATQRGKRESKAEGKTPSTANSKPDQSKTRTWTDRSGSFKVEAEFIGLKDGKIHLHKLNGVKIAVPVPKMAVEDLEYVERVTGVSLDEDKPLSDIRRRSLQGGTSKDLKKPSNPVSDKSKTGASIEPPKQPDYDWFDFFLKCGVGPHQCERYASSFTRDSMDESVLPDITPSVLRTLGLKEGDILRVMKFLDKKYVRSGPKSKLRNVSFGGEEVIDKGDDPNEDGSVPSSGATGGLFSGPGGTLRNNTRKGRPAPAVQVNDVIDAKALGLKNGADTGKKSLLPDASDTALDAASKPRQKGSGGFDDDAWDVKPSKQHQSNATGPAPPTAAPTPQVTAPSQPALTGALAELSLLTPPLQPTVTHTTGPPQELQVQAVPQPQQPQTTGANPSFFSQLGLQQTGPPLQSNNLYQASPMQTPSSQPNTISQQQTPQIIPPRQRPQAPQTMQSGSLMPPPPPRPLSAPQNYPQQNGFGPPPLQPQLTGFQTSSSFQTQVAPVGQSLNELNQMRAQQLMGQQRMMAQPTGFGQQDRGFNGFGNALLSQPTGFGGQQQQQQQQQPGILATPNFLNGQQTGSPFADPRQPPQMSGFQPMMPQMTGAQPPMPSPAPQLQFQPTGINSFLPPALQPQQTGTNGFGRPAFGQSLPPVPPIPQQPTIAPLQPQKTGPPPPVRFGVTGEAKKLAPQPTGRRANLSHATPQNPFGF